jgi:hypothetical protein
MPPRYLSLVIVLCWLGMSAWMFTRDLWPKLRPGEPPPYTWMPSDELPSRKNSPPIRWNVFHNGSYAYDLEARTIYHEKGSGPAGDDTFEMRGFLRVKQQPGQKAPVRRVRSFLHITRDSELRAVNAQLHMVIKDWEILIELEGLVQDGELLPRCRIKVYPAEPLDSEERVFDRMDPLQTPPAYPVPDIPFRPIEFAKRGIVLNPLHPPNRIDTLRPGQHWSMPLVGNLMVLEALGSMQDALAAGRSLPDLMDMVAASLGGALAAVPILDAQVLPAPEPLPSAPVQDLPPGQPPLCWVIEARDKEDRVHGRLWIQQSEGERKGLVLRQEVVLKNQRGDDVWIVQREQ